MESHSEGPFTEEELERLKSDEDLYRAALKLIWEDMDVVTATIGQVRATIRGWM